MAGNLRTVCFLLSPERRTRRREREVKETAENLRQYGMEAKVCTFSSGGHEEDGGGPSGNLHPGERESRFENVTETLYLADSAEGYRELRVAGCPAAGYLHDGNEGETFPGADYLLEQPEEVDADSYVKIWQRLTGRPWTIAVTERLVIREETPEDLDGRYLLYDETARRFLEPPSDDREKERDILCAYIRKVYGFCGFGMWGIFDRTSGEMIGRIGFEPYQGAGSAVDFGYLIRKDRRGEGLAKEAGTAVLRFAAESLGLEKVCIHTAEDNTASIHLALQLGFHEEREQEEQIRESGNKNAAESRALKRTECGSAVRTGGTVDAGQKTGIRYFVKDLQTSTGERI